MPPSTAPAPASAPQRGGDEQPPFVHLRLVDGRPELRGLATCLLGHRLEVPGRERPDGIFAEWAWDGQRLVARNDRYGVKPLYYFARDGELALAPSIPTLVRLGAPRALDERALAVFLRVGYFLGEDTPLAAIRRLPPDATLTWQDGRLEVTGGFTVPEPAERSRRATIDRLVELFRQAMRRRVVEDGDVAVPLSGGQDSRHILLELCASGHRPRFCVTFGPWWGAAARDLPVAQSVASALELDHVTLRVPGARLPSELRKNPLVSFGSRRHAQYLPLVDFLHGRVSAVYDGLAGALVRNRLVTKQSLALVQTGDLEAMAHFFLRRGADPDGFLSDEGRGRFHPDLALEALIAELKPHAAAADPLGSFGFWAIERENALVPHALYSGVPTVFSPYLDHDFFDFQASIPASLKVDHRLHAEAIRRGYPDRPQIPFGRWQLTPGLPWHTRRFCLEALSYLARRPSRLVDRARAARCLLDGARRGQTTIDVRMLVYLLQLERFLDD